MTTDARVGLKRGFTVEEACMYLGGISRMGLHRLKVAGKLSSYNIGVRVYYTRESLDGFINSQIDSGE